MTIAIGYGILFICKDWGVAPCKWGRYMKLILIRHAEPDYSIDSLTEKGKREAALLVPRMGSLQNITGIYTSPLGRAKETATIAAKGLGIEPVVLPWAREFAGTIVDPETGNQRIPWDLKHKWFENEPTLFDESCWADHPFMTTGEVSVKKIYQETCQGVAELLANHGYVLQENRMFSCKENKEETLVLFCHMGIAMAIVGFLTQISPFSLWHGFCMPPSSVTTLVTEEREKGLMSFRCFQVGDTSHLAVGNEPPSRMAMFQEVFRGTDHTNAT